MFTQPHLYNVIKQHDTPLALYSKQLVREGVLSEAEVEQLTDSINASLTEKFVKRNDWKPSDKDWLLSSSNWVGMKSEQLHSEICPTGVPINRLRQIGPRHFAASQGFTVHPIGLTKAGTLSLKLTRRMPLPIVFFVFFIFTNAQSLRYVNVPILTVWKSFGPMFVTLFERFYFRDRFSTAVYPDWNSPYNFLALTLKGHGDVYVAFNCSPDPRDVELPHQDAQWGRVVDTNLDGDD